MDQTPLIVVIDDEREILDILEIIITNAGYRVQIISNFDEEKILSLGNRATLFIMDLGAPTQVGLKLARKLDVKNNPYELIIMTGGSELNWAEQAKALGVIDFLHKPFSSEKLLSCIAHGLKSAAQKAARSQS